jgi:hypothetical protein
MRKTTHKPTGVFGLATQRRNNPITGDGLPRLVRQQPDVGVGPTVSKGFAMQLLAGHQKKPAGSVKHTQLADAA